VALLEAGNRANVEALAHELSMEIAFGEANTPIGHMAWLSRLPIHRAENHRHPGLAKTLLEIEVNWADVPLHLFATHLSSRWDPPEPVEEIPIILDLLRSPISLTCWWGTSMPCAPAIPLDHCPREWRSEETRPTAHHATPSGCSWMPGTSTAIAHNILNHLGTPIHQLAPGCAWTTFSRPHRSLHRCMTATSSMLMMLSPRRITSRSGPFSARTRHTRVRTRAGALLVREESTRLGRRSRASDCYPDMAMPRRTRSLQDRP